MISFEKASKRFGNLDAVKEFSLDIHDKEILGLLGPNGAGKTTLMLMLGTVYRPTNGNISVDGLDVIKDLDDIRKENVCGSQETCTYGKVRALEVLNWQLKKTT